MRDTDRSGCLRFEPEGQATTSSQLGPKSKKRTAPKKGDSYNTIPPDVPSTAKDSTGPVPSDMTNKKLRSEDETSPDTFSSMESTSVTPDQFGPKSGKLRQDSKKPQPSKRLRCDGEPPPGDESASRDGSTNKETAQDGKRMGKSKLRMGKSGKKLNTAHEKLATQKLPKKPGPVKTISRATRYRLWWYAHGRIHQVEHENAGTEVVYKTELAEEHLVWGNARFIKHRIRARPARRVRKWEDKHISARADYTYRQLVKENPGLQNNPVSRF